MTKEITKSKHAYKTSLSVVATLTRNAIPSFRKPSKTLIIANMSIFSWAIIEALKGTVTKFTAKISIEQCITQLAASNLSSGILSLLFKNHIPTSSIIIIMKIAITVCIMTELEKTLDNLSKFFSPREKVINLLTDAENEAVIIENIETTPPTTLYIP